MPQKRIFKRMLSKTARSLKRAQGAPAAVSQTNTAVAHKIQYDDEGTTEQDIECSSMVQKASEYMIKVDERQLELANAFRLAWFVGVFDGQVQITIRGERREIEGCSRMIRAFKTHLHKTTKLMPWESEPAFKEGGFNEDGLGSHCHRQARLPMESALDTQPKLKDIVDFLKVRCWDTL